MTDRATSWSHVRSLHHPVLSSSRRNPSLVRTAVTRHLLHFTLFPGLFIHSCAAIHDSITCRAVSSSQSSPTDLVSGDRPPYMTLILSPLDRISRCSPVDFLVWTVTPQRAHVRKSPG